MELLSKLRLPEPLRRLYAFAVCVIAVSLIGCHKQQPVAPDAKAADEQISADGQARTLSPNQANDGQSGSQSTVEQVGSIVARLLKLERSKVLATTSLNDLNFDELDLVELVLELEDTFSISLPDDAIEHQLGIVTGQRGLKYIGNVTIEKIAKLVDERKKLPKELPTTSAR